MTLDNFFKTDLNIQKEDKMEKENINEDVSFLKFDDSSKKGSKKMKHFSGKFVGRTTSSKNIILFYDISSFRVSEDYLLERFKKQFNPTLIAFSQETLDEEVYLKVFLGFSKITTISSLSKFSFTYKCKKINPIKIAVTLTSDYNFRSFIGDQDPKAINYYMRCKGNYVKTTKEDFCANAIHYRNWQFFESKKLFTIATVLDNPQNFINNQKLIFMK